ncbi:MAG: DUF86 domain-containing protein [Ignavibacteriales bacterium]|nr:DUF86 domain-containing protein [Ignavibacteriales bacterium]
MSPNRKNDLLYLLNILEAIKKIEVYIGGINDAESFYIKDEQLQFNACLSLLTHIGESVNKICSELKNDETSVDWKNISGFRNRIAHDYTGLDIFIVFRIIEEELPMLEEKIYLLINKNLSTGYLIRMSFMQQK